MKDYVRMSFQNKMLAMLHSLKIKRWKIDRQRNWQLQAQTYF